MKASDNRQKIAPIDRFTQFTVGPPPTRRLPSRACFRGGRCTQKSWALCLVRQAAEFSTWGRLNYRAVYAEGKNRVHPFVVPRLMN